MKANFGVILAFFLTVVCADAQNAGHSSLANFEKRRAGTAARLSEEQAAAAESMKERLPRVRIDWDALLSSPRFILNDLGFLSAPDGADEHLFPGARPDPLAGDPHKAVKRFLNENSGLFGFDAAILATARISREFSTAHTGLRTIVWEQQLDGIPVFEAVLYGHISKIENW